MLAISTDEISVRIHRDNFWWSDPDAEIIEAQSPRRVYFDSFKSIALNFRVRRATVLLGPRRVGKTFMIKQLIHEARQNGMSPNNILYASIDTPIYSGISLEKFLDFLPTQYSEQKLVIFDEIQYLKDWEMHLKDLIDTYPSVKFVASGSAAAALRLKSQESGAGRFSDFMLPPLTFYEFLMFIGQDEHLIKKHGRTYTTKNILELNNRFIDYLNFGGYPEAVLNEEIRNNPEQFIRNDIIDKVLLKDLPSLYGIDQIQELNRLFSFLAYNAGNEASLENISQQSGLAKPTIKKYIEYLESAFLIIKLSTVNENAKSLKRERNFKVYLNNPSMRAALFAPVSADDTERVGHLAESAIFAQWQHSPAFRDLRYARWKNEGEVDVVYLGGAESKPMWIGEIKWSDRIQAHFGDQTRSMATLLKKHHTVESAFFTTKSVTSRTEIEHTFLKIIPSALYAYTVGRNVTSPSGKLGLDYEEG